MNDLDFLFFLIPGLVLSIVAVTLWLTLRAHRRFRREMFGGENAPLFAAFFPSSSSGLRHHSSGHGDGVHGDGGHIDHGGTHHSSGFPHADDYSSPTEYSGHGPSYSGHGPSHDYSSSSYDSGSSSSDWGSSSSSSSDSGSSSSW